MTKARLLEGLQDDSYQMMWSCREMKICIYPGEIILNQDKPQMEMDGVI